MKRSAAWVLILLFVQPVLTSAQMRLRFATQAGAPPSSDNPIVASRVPVSTAIPNPVWAAAGATIPAVRTNCVSAACNTLFGGSVSSSTINAAIASCGTNEIVRVPAGSYSITTITFSRSNCTLQASPLGSVKITFTSATSRCHLSQGGSLSFCAASANIGVDSPDNTATWSAGYAVGTTTVTVSSKTNMVAGQTIIFLDQLNDSSDGWPATGDIWVCTGGSDTQCSNQGGGGNYARSGRALVTPHLVTSVPGTACPCAIGIDPPISAPSYRSGQSPGAWWGNTGNIIRNSGVEGFTFDFTGTQQPGLQLVNAYNVWEKGNRWIYNTVASTDVFHNMIVNCFRCTIRDNYFYGPTTAATQNYQVAPHVSGSLLVENNIFDRPVSGYVPNGPVTDSVFAFNFQNGWNFTGPCIIEHGFTMMNLYEGNNCSGILSDIIHAPHFFITAFRNHFDGQTHNQPANVNTAVSFRSHARFSNVVGNVLGRQGQYTTYSTNQGQGDSSIYSWGWQSNDSPIPGPTLVPNDSRSLATAFLWCNYDTVNGTNEASTNDLTGIRCLSSETPTGITNFAQTVPATTTLPPSMYLSERPAFMGSRPWPVAGPDVTNGDASGYGGHAYLIPARMCWEAATNDPAYATSNPRIKLETGANCPAVP